LSKLNERNPLSKAVRNALIASAAVAVAMPSVVYAEEESDDENKITITGSRIKRTDVEGALPVTVITRAQIDASGESSAADFLRSMTFNSSGSYRPQSGSSFQGVSSISLRGVGASRTLVLVDGRRLPKSPQTGASNDINLIPLGAIERIEVLTDGASAVYGSDAIGGVVNIITKSDFDGVQITLGQQSVSIPSNGGDREEGSILFGTTSEKSSVMGGVSWNNRDIIFARDFPWNPGGGSSFSNNWSTLDANGADRFDTRPLGDCNFPGTAFFSIASSAPNREPGSIDRCAYDFTEVSADEASTQNKSLWLKGKHEINSDWDVWGSFSVNKTDSFGRYAPVPDGTLFTGNPIAADSPNNPTNPNSPLYDPDARTEHLVDGNDDVLPYLQQDLLTQQPVSWWHRFDALGNRDNVVDTELTDAQFGFTGMVGEAELDFGLRRTTNRTSSIGRNYLNRAAAQGFIDSGEYSFADPYGASDEVLAAMNVTTSQIAKYDQNEFWGSVTFDAFEMNAGVAQVYIGAEYREEFYDDKYDRGSEAGLVGGSSGNSAGGNRDVTSIFFETLLPITEDLEVTIAGRSDDYSDYGSDFSPKISARWQPQEDLTLRASYGQGFRAPSLDILTQLDSESADSVRDPASCANQSLPANCSLQINGTRTANPNLDSENSTQFSAGVAFQPTDWFSMTADYWNTEIENRIKFFSAQVLVNAELQGTPIPSGLSVNRASNGAITSIIQGYGNEGDLKTAGIDFNFRFNFDLGGGKLTNNIQLAHLLDQSLVDNGVEGADLIKDPGTPEQRLAISNVYTISDFSFAYNLNLIGEQYDDIDNTLDANGRVVSQDKTGHTPTWVTHDIQASYQTSWDGKISVGVRNIGEKYPPIGHGFVDARDYDFNLYDGYGRVTYVRYTQSF